MLENYKSLLLFNQRLRSESENVKFGSVRIDSECIIKLQIDIIFFLESIKQYIIIINVYAYILYFLCFSHIFFFLFCFSGTVVNLST